MYASKDPIHIGSLLQACSMTVPKAGEHVTVDTRLHELAVLHIHHIHSIFITFSIQHAYMLNDIF